ncbi:unnamed protein product [Adineta steineri]|uniref:PPIase cyclophilin-type domain-containing protein n=1 Tax=Adineta steineri TaxID=433720 RepID=A0A814XWB2_9BILA|nr:unnamed protein product [Adineta steineri]CAF1257669.1 unnamed protein product [Adineta steineri]CAF1436891.1 unnamed protein product [Adineta steineri]CAF1546245.1 unnamed protein product [Adineta steineri]
MCDQSIIIKLFDTVASVACDLFRGCCGSKYNYNYEGSTLNYVMKNKFITGGDVLISNSDGSKFINKIKEKHLNSLLHDREGLITMDLSKSLTRFSITSGPAETLNGNSVVFGEIINGMEIIQSIADRYQDVDADGGARLTNIKIYSCGEK